ncbi:hypothetical protein Tco_0355206 [Tanacetum coccineum]
MKLSENEADVAEATNLHLIQTLQTSSIPNTLSFKSKWSLINNKLSDLTSLLTNLPTNNNPLTLNIMASLSHTLTQALSLSYTCHVTNPPKLKTQNDVVSIISRLLNHIHDCDVIVNSSPLHDDIIITTKKESTRAECRSIMTRLQIGESRDSTLDSLLSLLNEDDKHVLICVAQGVVLVLVKLLDNARSSPGIKEKMV